MFFKNGYPKLFFKRICDETLDKLRKKDQNNSETTEENMQNDPEMEESNNTKQKYKPMLKIPFVGKPSLIFSRRVKKFAKSTYNVETRTIFQTSKVKDYFRLKDVSPTDITSKVVYKFICSSDSNTEYIGHTNRSFIERVKDLRGGSAVSDHIASCDPCNKNASIKNFMIIKRCRENYDTMVYEAMFIKRTNPLLNRQLVKPQKEFVLQVFN